MAWNGIPEIVEGEVYTFRNMNTYVRDIELDEVNKTVKIDVGDSIITLRHDRCDVKYNKFIDGVIDNMSTCEYCGIQSNERNPWGGCVACGAPIYTNDKNEPRGTRFIKNIPVTRELIDDACLLDNSIFGASVFGA